MRTKKTLKNIITSVSLTLIVGLLGLLKVKVFVNGLSTDIYSLNQLFYQVFSYLTIADVGFSLLLSKKLYAAFAKDDKEEVIKVYSTSKKFYRIIGTVMLAIALVLSFFVHYLTKAELSNAYIQLIFIIYIIRNVIDYFFVAPRYVLEANEQSYKINYLIKGIKIVEMIIEMILVLLKVNYVFILIPGIIITIVVDLYANNKVFKTYPWLKDDKTFNKSYLKGTKDMIWRKGADLLNSNTDIILISTFVDPISVVIYTSYIYITKFITDVVYLVSNAITPSFANVLFKENEEKTYSVFTEINTLFQFIASFVNIMLFGFLTQLIIFWVGEEYIVNDFVLFLFTFITFQTIADKSIAIIINSKCLFKETKVATIIEALLNFTISIILVNKVGMMGVLVGTIISKLCTTFFYNAIYIYKNEFKRNPIHYFLQYGLVVIINLAFIFVIKIINLQVNSILSWILYVLLFAVIVGIILTILFSAFFKSFRLLLKRGIEFIKVKGKYSE